MISNTRHDDYKSAFTALSTGGQDSNNSDTKLQTRCFDYDMSCNKP